MLTVLFCLKGFYYKYLFTYFVCHSFVWFILFKCLSHGSHRHIYETLFCLTGLYLGIHSHVFMVLFCLTGLYPGSHSHMLTVRFCLTRLYLGSHSHVLTV